MTGEKITLEELKQLAEEANSDFFDNVTQETLDVISNCCDFLDEDFPEYLKYEKDLKEQVRTICPNNFEEKWKLYLKVYLQMEEQSNIRDMDLKAVMQLLPFVSDMRFIIDTLEIKVDYMRSELIYLFANVGADEYGEDKGWFYAWWD